MQLVSCKKSFSFGTVGLFVLLAAVVVVREANSLSIRTTTYYDEICSIPTTAKTLQFGGIDEDDAYNGTTTLGE